MNLKSQLCEAVRVFQINDGITNRDIYDNTSVNKTQLFYIQNRDGNNVSIDKIEEVLNYMGYQVTVNYKLLDESSVDDELSFYRNISPS